MPKFKTYTNSYTGEIAKYVRSEIMPNSTVHVLLIDGREYTFDEVSFLKDWTLRTWYA